MYCNHCGAQCEDGSRFCSECGSPLTAGVQTNTNQQQDFNQQQTIQNEHIPQGTAEQPQQPQQPMNEFFPCGIFQPPGCKVFGVIENAVIYGNEMFCFDKIDMLAKNNDSSPVTNGVWRMRGYGREEMLVYKHSDRERALYALNYAQRKVAEAHGQQIFQESKEGLLHDLNGVRGRHMEVYEDRVVLSVKATFGSFITGNISDGEKTIYYADCIGVQFKESGLQIGYLQFETAGRIMNNAASNFFNENTFTWDTTVQTNEFMHTIAAYVKERISFYKQQRNAPVTQAVSGADELKKFKELLDMGVITQEEFDKKKQQILGF